MSRTINISAGTKISSAKRRCRGVGLRCRYGSPNISFLSSYPSGIFFSSFTPLIISHLPALSQYDITIHLSCIRDCVPKLVRDNISMPRGSCLTNRLRFGARSPSSDQPTFCAQDTAASCLQDSITQKESHMQAIICYNISKLFDI